MDAVQLMRDDVSLFYKFSSLIMDIREMLKGHWEIDILYSLREANSCADYLANNSAKKIEYSSIWE